MPPKKTETQKLTHSIGSFKCKSAIFDFFCRIKIRNNSTSSEVMRHLLDFCLSNESLIPLIQHDNPIPFDDFLAIYPKSKHTHKPKAQIAWNALNVDQKLFDEIEQHVNQRVKAIKHLRFLPNPYDFIYNRRWQEPIPEQLDLYSDNGESFLDRHTDSTWADMFRDPDNND